MKKNPDRTDLKTFRVHFIGGTKQDFHTPDDLIAVASKPDKGGFHPIVYSKGEWLINLDNVLYIEDVTPDEPAR